MKIPAFDTHRFSSEQSPRRPPARRRGIGRPPDRDQSLDGAFLTWRAAVPRSREPDRDLGLRRTSFPERTKSPASSAAPRDRAPSRSGSKLRWGIPDLDGGLRSLAAVNPIKTPAFDTHLFPNEQSPRRPARRRGTGRPPDRDQSFDRSFLTWRLAVPRNRGKIRTLQLW